MADSANFYFSARVWRSASNKVMAADDDKLSERTGPGMGIVYRRSL